MRSSQSALRRDHVARHAPRDQGPWVAPPLSRRPGRPRRAAADQSSGAARKASTSASVAASKCPPARASASTSRQVARWCSLSPCPASAASRPGEDAVVEDDERVRDLAAGGADRLGEAQLRAAVGGEVLDQQHPRALGHRALDLGVAPEALGLLAHVEHRQAEPLGDPGGERDAGGLAAGDRVERLEARVAQELGAGEVHQRAADARERRSACGSRCRPARRARRSAGRARRGGSAPPRPRAASRAVSRAISASGGKLYDGHRDLLGQSATRQWSGRAGVEDHHRPVAGLDQRGRPTGASARSSRSRASGSAAAGRTPARGGSRSPPAGRARPPPRRPAPARPSPPAPRTPRRSRRPPPWPRAACGALSVPRKNRGSPPVAARRSASRWRSRLATGRQ